MNPKKQYGVLYMVATPIGHLSDIGYRAVSVLKTVDFIVAESPRHSTRLLTNYGIQTTLLGLKRFFHAPNPNSPGPTYYYPALIDHLCAGKNLAFITDAGTPGISDPGRLLCASARNAGIRIVPIPGPCALTTALSASGLSGQAFQFLGFLPNKEQARHKVLNGLRTQTHTLIFYEAPHRLLDCLNTMIACFGAQRRAVIVKELTKQFETYRSDTLTALHTALQSQAVSQKGEWVIILEGASKQESERIAYEQACTLLDTLLQDLSVSQAVALACRLTGQAKNKLYKEAIRIQRAGSLGQIERY